MTTTNHEDHRQDVFEIARALFRGGFDLLKVSATLGIYAKNGNYNLEGKEVHDIVKKACDPKEKEKTGITGQVKEWVLTTDGHFLTPDCHRELQLTTKTTKKAANMALLRLVNDGVLEKYGLKRGCYRLVNKECDDIDYMNVEVEPMRLSWPFKNLGEMVELYPKNIVVVAGEPNVGKTGFMLDFARRNMEAHEIVYFSSEMGGVELRKRLLQFNQPLDSWKWQVKEKSCDFQDVIQPNKINIIDFLELHDNFYLVSGIMRAVYEKLENGIALIALQKNRGRDEGLGGMRSLEKPRLYLSLSSEYPGGRCKIVKAKNWATGDNPNGYSVKYKLIGGCRFKEAGEWELKN